MSWLAWLTGGKPLATTVKVANKEIVVQWSASADKVLARRDRPLIVGVELAFACMAKKQLRFSDTVGGQAVIAVTDKLVLQLITVVPDICGMDPASVGTAVNMPSFVPRWVRIDHAKGQWSGEYGL